MPCISVYAQNADLSRLQVFGCSVSISHYKAEIAVNSRSASASRSLSPRQTVILFPGTIQRSRYSSSISSFMQYSAAKLLITPAAASASPPARRFREIRPRLYSALPAEILPPEHRRVRQFRRRHCTFHSYPGSATVSASMPQTFLPFKSTSLTHLIFASSPSVRHTATPAIGVNRRSFSGLSALPAGRSCKLPCSRERKSSGQPARARRSVSPPEPPSCFQAPFSASSAIRIFVESTHSKNLSSTFLPQPVSLRDTSSIKSLSILPRLYLQSAPLYTQHFQFQRGSSVSRASQAYAF